jgi:hypothetical protein
MTNLLDDVKARVEGITVYPHPNFMTLPATYVGISISDLKSLISALQAVLEIHKPITQFDREVCNECSATYSRPHPCPTVQAIAKELGVE